MSITSAESPQDEPHLKQVLEECKRLREENERLRAMLGMNHSTTNQTPSQSSPNLKPSLQSLGEVYTPERKIALFRNLFRGREDVFAMRSGNGAHVWMFFDRPVSAVDARRLGCALLTRTMERRHEIGLDSYDRLFPSQDTMPKGGFGNLIALPLQKQPRDQGNTVFLDELFRPHADQWRFLETIQRIPAQRLANIIHDMVPAGNPVGVHLSFADEDEGEAPWHRSPSRKRRDETISGPMPPSVGLVVSNLVYIEKKDLPSALVDRLIRVAAFQNPEFYRAQAMRLSTYGKPRVISCGEIFPEHVGLPRGLLEEALSLWEAHGINVEIDDQRCDGNEIDTSFRGKLSALQMKAAVALRAHDHAILCAPTAFGKTVVAA